MKRKGPRREHQPPKVVQKRLRVNHAFADNVRNEIAIDTKLSGRAKLEAIVHEFVHLKEWALPEPMVRKFSRELTALLHENNVRIIEPGDVPLELGKP